MKVLALALLLLPIASLAADCRVLDPELQGAYEGGCRKGLAHGEGVATGSAEYRGEFRNGMKHGTGVKTWAWGDRYEGGFVNDRKSGKGMYTWGAGSPWAMMARSRACGRAPFSAHDLFGGRSICPVVSGGAGLCAIVGAWSATGRLNRATSWATTC